jgi:hypothetical protein
LLASLLLYATYAAHAEVAALPSGNDSKVQSSIVALRELAVLLDEDPADPTGKKYSGYVVWRIEKVQQAGEKPDVAIRADIDIPERKSENGDFVETQHGSSSTNASHAGGHF